MSRRLKSFIVDVACDTTFGNCLPLNSLHHGGYSSGPVCCHHILVGSHNGAFTTSWIRAVIWMDDQADANG